ncbi:DNA translocase FtsK [Kingella negevensis]|uniref:DNA translocase FtsK n=1 Tax=Kingella negevensis TaxID=1522312 RepID=UPI00050A0469|nr:DNA translocase FtsK [Kingella negevensis]
MMYLLLILVLAILGGLVWLQRKQEQEWLQEIARASKPLDYKQPVAQAPEESSDELLDDSDDLHIDDIKEITEIAPSKWLDTLPTNEEEIAASSADTDINHDITEDIFSAPSAPVVVDSGSHFVETKFDMDSSEPVETPNESAFTFTLIDEEPSQPEKKYELDNSFFEQQNQSLLKELSQSHVVPAKAEVITLEDATRNILTAHKTLEAEQPKVVVTAPDVALSQLIKPVSVTESENTSANFAHEEAETTQPEILVSKQKMEVITEDDPFIHRTRNKTLAELADFQQPENPATQDETRPEKAEVELQTIGIEDIQHSLTRRHSARQLQQVEQNSEPFKELEVIPDNEVWANLAHQYTPAHRRSKVGFSTQANRATAHSAAAPISGVAIAAAPMFPELAATVPNIPEPASFNKTSHAEEFAMDFFNSTKHKAQAPVQAAKQDIAPEKEEDIFSEEDFENYYAEEKQVAHSEDNFDDEPNTIPPLDILAPAEYDETAIQTQEELEANSRTIEEKLAEFRVKVNVVDAYSGPVITRYEIEPDVGVRGSSVLNLEKDLARSLGVASIRVVETIPGKTCMGLELPNPNRQMIRLSEIFNSPEFSGSQSKLTIALGQDITGEPVVTDLAKAPHLLVAGTTGSGKSVGVNAMILSMLYKATPDEVRMIMIDPKMLELSIYEGIPHLLAPVVTDMKLAANALNWCVNKMEKRYRFMSHVGVRNLASYNEKIQAAAAKGQKIPNPFSFTPDDPEPLEKLPYIVVVVDEFADLMMVAGKQIEQLIARLAQKARAAGIHLILATQRPSVDVITGLIKANIPTRIAFQVSSKIDSRTIIDQMGAENLLGQGDMLFLPPGTSYPQRVHGAFVADNEVHEVVEYLKQLGEPDYIDDILTPETNEYDFASSPTGDRDALLDQAVEVILRTKKTSISSLQRQLRIGYNKAATIMEQLEAEGVVSAADHSGKRTILARRTD